MTAPVFVGQRYRLLDPLGAGRTGQVYRALDRLTGHYIALKQVLAPPEHAQIERGDPRLALAQEFETLASLRHPHIISVLDYGFDADGQPYFTMELLPDRQTILDAARGQPLDTVIDLLAQLLRALTYVHARGILHQDLKPGNVLVSQGQVKVLDFSLSVRARSARGVTGTLAYIAPEVLSGTPPGIASDLYAVGIMAFQLLVGRHPFDDRTSSNLINSVLYGQPDLSLLDVAPPLVDVVARLLAKAPDQRYANASEVIDALSRATGFLLAQETRATRESFLQASKFVGRNAELAQLLTALRQALEGRGSLWLVGGESGVGKSRLLDEVRTRALVQGALVLRGQGLDHGAPPFQVWHDPVRRLVLATPIDDLEASTLKTFVPDIGALLEREIPDAPPLETNTAQQRLVGTLVGLFRRQAQPVVLLLEDLQWADASLIPLLALSRAVADLPLLVIGSYRDDEHPDLPDSLPGAFVLKLERLSEDTIAELSASMLGEAGREPHIVQFLQRETEGNVFFLIETVRALAEEAGQLRDIGRLPLPVRLLPGGIQQVLQRHLGRVPPDYRDLLKLAAVAGRHLDLGVLRAGLDRLAADSPVDLNAALFACAYVAVLEAEGGRWRFTHDKLREALLVELEAAERARLHRHLAEAIESVYPGDVTQASVLVAHWHAAGHPIKEGYYARLAGEQALHSGASHHASSLLRRALELLQAQPHSPDHPHQEFELYRLLGAALMATRGWAAPEVRQIYARLRELAPLVGEAGQFFSALWGLWAAHLLQADHATTASLASQLMDLAGSLQDPDLLLEAELALAVTARNSGDLLGALPHYETVITTYEKNRFGHHAFRYGQDPGVVALGQSPDVLWLLGYPDHARVRLETGRELAVRLGHPFSLAHNLWSRGLVYQYLRDLDAILTVTGELTTLATEHEFAVPLAAAQILRGWALVLQGQPGGIALLQEGLTAYQQSGTEFAYPHYLTLLAEAYGATGQIDTALNTVDLALQHVDLARYFASEMYRVKGTLLLAKGNVNSAESHFQWAASIARSQAARSLELRASVNLCRLWQRRGLVAEAHERLFDVYSWFTEGFATRDLQQAKTLLDALR